MVYKLVDINGVAKIKLSDEREKTTLPGEKQILRIYTARSDGKLQPTLDVICLIHETEELLATFKDNKDSNKLSVYEAFGDNHPHIFTPARVEALSTLMFDCGKQTYEFPHI